jgi:hypothetical protein
VHPCAETAEGGEAAAGARGQHCGGVLCLRRRCAAAAHAPVARQEVLHGEALGLCAACRFPGKVS